MGHDYAKHLQTTFRHLVAAIIQIDTQITPGPHAYVYTSSLDGMFGAVALTKGAN